MENSVIHKLKEVSIIRNVYRVIRKGISNLQKVAMNIIGFVFIVPFAKLLPKKNQVVLGSRFGDFEGNLKYLFLYLNSLDEDTEFVFLTEKSKIYKNLQKEGFTVWRYPEPATLLKLLQVKVFIADGNEWAAGFKYFFLKGAKNIQIWHGTGLKAIGLLKPNYKALGAFHKFFRKENTRYDLLALSSEDQVNNRGKAFHYKELLINGLPRNDVFFNEEVLKRSLAFEGESLKPFEKFKEEGYTLVTYTPTWRKHQEEFHQLELESLESFGEQYKIKWILKLHYKHDIPINTEKYKHVIEYDKTADIYPLLAITDLLITDYSSIYLDFLLLNKPIVFYPYDEVEYVNGERELLLDYDSVTPGPKVYNQEELLNRVKDFVVAKEDRFQEERELLRKSFFEYRDGKSCERLWSKIKENYL